MGEEVAALQSVLFAQHRLVIDLGDLLRADPEARWASWQRARQAGVLSPNDIRLEEGWPRSSDPPADSSGVFAVKGQRSVAKCQCTLPAARIFPCLRGPISGFLGGTRC
jgi:hypothetical protein